MTKAVLIYNKIGNKQDAIDFIKNGGKCILKHGYWNEWYGYDCRNLTREEALRLVETNKFGFGSGRFWYLVWLDLIHEDGDTEKYLGFSEPASRDLE